MVLLQTKIISTKITNSITWLLQYKLNWFFESRILGLSIWPSSPPVVENQSSQVTKILRSIKETLNPHPYNPVLVVCSAKICSNLVKTSSLVIQTSTHSFTRSHLPFDFKWNVQVQTLMNNMPCVTFYLLPKWKQKPKENFVTKNGCTHFASNDISRTEPKYFHQNTTQIDWGHTSQV
jgi:hypothetical protein